MSNFKTRKLPTPKKIIKTIAPETFSDTPVPIVKQGTLKKWIVGTLIGLLSLLFIGTIALRALGGISITPDNNGVSFVPIPAIDIGSGTVDKIAGTKNILIAGIGGAWHDGSLLTDSIMLASINSDGGYVTLISIPRDLYVAYPKGYGTAGKINALYSMWVSNKIGIKLLAEKVSEITGQGIDGYIVIDFSGFKNIVDALGGISIDVPKDLVDREYPDNNWGYEVFSVKAGPQQFDGATALKYARSRHSTSDFDRSERQQLLLKWLKEKAFSLWLFTNPVQISELYTAVISHLDTSMKLGEIGEFALRLKDIETRHINIYNLSNECIGIRCTPGAYLYTPAREYFGGASVVVPENASATRLSYYDDIRRFTGFIFRFPDIRKERYPISIIAGKGKTNQAKLIITTLGKLGINFDDKKTLTESTGSISNSHINIYWNNEAEIWTHPSAPILQALRFLEEKIPYSTVIRNEYITTDWPRIEIVIGNDIGSYFTFAKPAYYLPYLAPPIEGSGSTGTKLSPTISWESTVQIQPRRSTSNSTQQAISPPKDPSPDTFSVVPWQWEEF
jgi:LCP family protein required for cell wall assembly